MFNPFVEKLVLANNKLIGKQLIGINVRNMISHI